MVFDRSNSCSCRSPVPSLGIPSATNWVAAGANLSGDIAVRCAGKSRKALSREKKHFAIAPHVDEYCTTRCPAIALRSPMTYPIEV